MVYGIDFGTSNTVVAVESGGASRVLSLDGEGGVLPSLLYVERDRQASVGRRAMADYASALERWRGAGDLYSRFRFFQALKLALKDEDFKGTSVFGDYWPAETLVGVFLRELRRMADEASGGCARSAVLGRPVVLSRDGAKDARLQERFRAACALAGFDEVSFVYEPVGAVVSLVGEIEGSVLVFDFGGGTLDITVARLGRAEVPRRGSVEILASAGADLGGYLLNEDISRARIIRHFGYGSRFRTMTGRSLEIPRWITNQVASFYALPLHDISATRALIKELAFEAEEKESLKGLYDFLNRNLAFELFRRIDEAKIALSAEDAAWVSFSVPPHVAFEERLTREEFEAMIAGRVEAARRLVLEATAAAGLETGDIAHVVRVGGSSLVPAFAAMLESLFPERVREGAVFTSIATGLVAARDRGLGVI